MALISDPSIVSGALAARFSTTTAAELRRRTVLTRFVDRRWDSELNSAESVAIRVPLIESDVVTTTTIHGSAAARAKANENWAAGAEPTSGQVILRRHTEFRPKPSQINELDQMQSPINQLERERADQSGKLVRQIETSLLAYFRSLTTTTNDPAVAADYPTAAGDGSNSNGGKIFTRAYGSATDKISPAGKAATDAAAGLVRQAMIDAHVHMTDSNWLNGSTLMGNSMMSPMPAAVMHTRLASVLMTDLEADGYYLPRLNASLLGLDSVGARLPGSGIAYEGDYKGFSIVSMPHPGLIPTSSRKSWEIFFVSPAAIAWSESPLLTQILTPATNQTAPVYAIRMRKFAGWQLTQRAALTSSTILSL